MRGFSGLESRRGRELVESILEYKSRTVYGLIRWDKHSVLAGTSLGRGASDASECMALLAGSGWVDCLH